MTAYLLTFITGSQLVINKKKMKIKVNYDIETNLVKGYYPDSINYKSIPEPYVEIEDIEQVNDKQMCVIDGVYQEYIKPRAEILLDEKKKKIAEIKSTAASEIKKIFTIEEQLNVLMSKDSEAISSMHNQINTILTTSRAEREKLKGAE